MQLRRNARPRRVYFLRLRSALGRRCYRLGALNARCSRFILSVCQTSSRSRQSSRHAVGLRAAASAPATPVFAHARAPTRDHAHRRDLFSSRKCRVRSRGSCVGLPSSNCFSLSYYFILLRQFWTLPASVAVYNRVRVNTDAKQSCCVSCSYCC